MADCMTFPDDYLDFIKGYAFKDTEKIYTNGSELIHVFRVHQMIAHYFPDENGWISVKDRLPKSGEHVLAVCEIRPIRRPSRKYICEAFYAEKYSIGDVCSEDEISYDYNEEEDEYYLKEGWYEVVHNWDEYSSIVIGDFVTHWMPLPEPPKDGDA